MVCGVCFRPLAATLAATLVASVLTARSNAAAEQRPFLGRPEGSPLRTGTNASSRALAATMCSNTCWQDFGFVDGDCQCSVNANWYMWVCTSRHGAPLPKTQYCNSESCNGCYDTGRPPLPPSPPPPSPSPAPAPSPTSFLPPSPPIPATTPAPVRSPGYEPPVAALLHSSEAPSFTFYMYRAQNDEDYPPENQNTGTLAGILWYLHNEIVWHTPRRFGKTRIERFQVQMKATQPLFDAGMNFGVRFAFDSGECTGPFNCTTEWDRYGYFVGCNNPGEFPTSQWAGAVHYPGAMWYSLPGACPSRHYYDHTSACELHQPGGACRGSPNGAGDCTYSYERVGEINIDALEGISNYDAFIAAGGEEYNREADRGVHLSFWNGKNDTQACQHRLERARQLFTDSYPDQPSDADLPAPACDFSYGRFYG